MDFTTEKILLGAAGSGEEESYWFVRIGGQPANPFKNDSDVAVDSTGNVYVTRPFYSYTGNPASGYPNPYQDSIYKLDSEGNYVWHKTNQYYSYSNSYASNGINWIEVVNDKPFYTITNPDHTGIVENLFRPNLSSCNSSGTNLTQVRLTYNAYHRDTPIDVTKDRYNNIYVASIIGNSSNSMQFHKFNSSGQYQFSSQPLGSYSGTSGNSFPNQQGAIVSTNNGLILAYNHSGSGAFYYGYNPNSSTYGFRAAQSYLQGVTWCAGDAQPNSNTFYLLGTLPSYLGGQAILVQYTDVGYNFNVNWAKTFGPNLNSNGKSASVKVDSTGDIYVTGSRFIWKLNSSGSLVWKREITANNSIYVSRLDLDSKDSMYIVGAIQSVCTFVLKLPKDGSLTGNYSSFAYPINYNALSETLGNGYNTASGMYTGTLSYATHRTWSSSSQNIGSASQNGSVNTDLF